MDSVVFRIHCCVVYLRKKLSVRTSYCNIALRQQENNHRSIDWSSAQLLEGRHNKQHIRSSSTNTTAIIITAAVGWWFKALQSAQKKLEELPLGEGRGRELQFRVINKIYPWYRNREVKKCSSATKWIEDYEEEDGEKKYLIFTQSSVHLCSTEATTANFLVYNAS